MVWLVSAGGPETIAVSGAMAGVASGGEASGGAGGASGGEASGTRASGTAASRLPPTTQTLSAVRQVYPDGHSPLAPQLERPPPVESF